MSEWVIRLVPLDRPVPVALRIRKLLKFALRALGLRCVEVAERADGDTEVEMHLRQPDRGVDPDLDRTAANAGRSVVRQGRDVAA